MKSVLKRVVSALLIVAIAATTMLLTAPVEVEAAGKMSYDKTMTVYLRTPYTTSSTLKIKNPKGSITSAKSTNTNILEITSYTSKRVCFTAKKAGTAKIKFKMKGKTYKCTVTVKKYTNPIKTLKVTGVNSKKNISGKFKKKSEVSLSLPKTKKNAKLVVQAADDWKLKSVYINKNSQSSKTKTYSGGTTKQKTISLGTLKKSKAYGFILTFKNKKTGGELEVELDLNYQ